MFKKVGQSGVRGTVGSLEPKFGTVPLKLDQFEIMKIKQIIVQWIVSHLQWQCDVP